MNERDYWTLKAMRTYGGGFIKFLAQLGHQADHVNLEKIKNTWPEYWGEYEGIGLSLEKTKKKENEQN